MAALAAEHGKTPAQVMLRWHLQQGRSAIPKSTNPSRIAQKQCSTWSSQKTE
ncbi:aldo/keto reductase [Actinoplanes sp. RD1]|uniref:aldo/keto reductase n=1 Tax=Actinoplanes sp. RD1 TaxID=3064538 RepID=UPI00355664BD